MERARRWAARAMERTKEVSRIERLLSQRQSPGTSTVTFSLDRYPQHCLHLHLQSWPMLYSLNLCTRNLGLSYEVDGPDYIFTSCPLPDRYILSHASGSTLIRNHSNERGDNPRENRWRDRYEKTHHPRSHSWRQTQRVHPPVNRTAAETTFRRVDVARGEYQDDKTRAGRPEMQRTAQTPSDSFCGTYQTGMGETAGRGDGCVEVRQGDKTRCRSQRREKSSKPGTTNDAVA